MKKLKLEKLLIVALIAFYLIVGALAIAFSFKDYSQPNGKTFLGIMTLLSAGPHIFIYFIEKGYENKQKSTYLFLSVVAICLGIVFITTENLTINQMCFMWGLLDIVRSSFELKEVLQDVRKDKIELIEVFISIGDIILGVLLCIHLEHGIPVHLYYFAFAYLVSSIKRIITSFFEKKEEEAE